MAPESPQPKSKLQAFFPNTKLPIIISAPMLGVSNGTLAAHVSKAGGIGMVPGGLDFKPGSAQLAALETELQAARSVLGLTELTLTPAPVGIGFLTLDPSAAQFRETVLPILEKYLPQAVWLFAPDPKAAERAHPGIIEACHDHGIKVFVQVGTVAAAREAARDGADVIVAQGVDAGGHQFASGAGVISLVPEVRAMLDDDFMGKDIALVAAGGIADPSAVVAAIALGKRAHSIYLRRALPPKRKLMTKQEPTVWSWAQRSVWVHPWVQLRHRSANYKAAVHTRQRVKSL